MTLESRVENLLQEVADLRRRVEALECRSEPVARVRDTKPLMRACYFCGAPALPAMEGETPRCTACAD